MSDDILRPRTPLEYRAYLQGFLYAHKMHEEAKTNNSTAVALAVVVDVYIHALCDEDLCAQEKKQ